MEDYDHFIGSTKQVSHFEVTTKFIINHVQEKFDSGKNFAASLSIMDSLSTGEWMPTVSASTVEDEDARDRHVREFELY